MTSALRVKGYEAFLPLHTVQRRWSDRVKDVELPLWPRYTFCRFQPESRVPVLEVPGVKAVVGFGGSPVPVEDEEIHALQELVRAGLPARPHRFVQSGERVRIERGPLRGVCGIVESGRGESRLILSVTLLQRSVAVEIDRDWVTAESGGAVHRFTVGGALQR